jgi:radical SAM superfamily enzyme YgiQ (UPF0313 family)
MPDIVLTTLNAKYAHTAFGLRYLLANLGSLRHRAVIVEFDIHQRPLDVAERLLVLRPRIIGLGVYIWNVVPATELVSLLKRIRPEICLILGGPEVSHEIASQPICQEADYVITGEADLAFRELCGQLLGGERPAEHLLSPAPPVFDELALPYDLYTDEDIAHRLTYVEASRGCPFKCEFCLSSLDGPVRRAPLEPLLLQLDRLLDRGARQLKFVDRTFNLHPEISRVILEHLYQRYRPGLFFHFEIVPDHLPEALREVVLRFPPGALQFEVGVQTFNSKVADGIERRQDYARTEDNLRFLRRQTGVHLHADLIVGLPGESLASFGAGFDRLVALSPQEIQVGILKRLRGTPIDRHDGEWNMVYSPQPPYEILANKLLDFGTLQRLRRFARYWDLIANSGNFLETAPMLWQDLHPAPPPVPAVQPKSISPPARRSPFQAFLSFSDWLFIQTGRTDSIALLRLAELFFRYLTEELRLDARLVGPAMLRDYQRSGRREHPGFLAGDSKPSCPPSAALGTSIPSRQRRHLG